MLKTIYFFPQSKLGTNGCYNGVEFLSLLFIGLATNLDADSDNVIFKWKNYMSK